MPRLLERASKFALDLQAKSISAPAGASSGTVALALGSSQIELQRMFEAAAASGAMRALQAAGVDPTRPLAIQNDGIGDQLNKRLDMLIPTAERAMEDYIWENEDEVREGAIDKYMGLRRKSVAMAAAERYMRDNDEGVQKAAAKLWLKQNPEMMQEAAGEYIEENNEEVKECAVKKYTEDNDLIDYAVEQYIEHNIEEVQQLAADHYLDQYKEDVAAAIVKDMPFDELEKVYEHAKNAKAEEEANKIALREAGKRRLATFLEANGPVVKRIKR